MPYFSIPIYTSVHYYFTFMKFFLFSHLWHENWWSQDFKEYEYCKWFSLYNLSDSANFLSRCTVMILSALHMNTETKCQFSHVVLMIFIKFHSNIQNNNR
jgi:hypothetical protein